MQYLMFTFFCLVVMGLLIWFSLKVKNSYLKTSLIALIILLPVLIGFSIFSYIMGTSVGERGEILRQSSVNTARYVKILKSMDKEQENKFYNAFEDQIKWLLSVQADFIMNRHNLKNTLVDRQWNYDQMFQRDMPFLMEYLKENDRLQEDKYKILFEKYLPATERKKSSSAPN